MPADAQRVPDFFVEPLPPCVGQRDDPFRQQPIAPSASARPMRQVLQVRAACRVCTPS
jgi:hypothetical protein